jgi:flagellar biosynthesis/type III secretory pathway ATPase
MRRKSNRFVRVAMAFPANIRVRRIIGERGREMRKEKRE